MIIIIFAVKLQISYKMYTNKELPYDSFKKIGITYEMIDDLPESAMNKILSGKYSPVIEIKSNNYGETYRMWTKFKIKDNGGRLDIVFAPCLSKDSLDNYSENDRLLLLKGQPVRKEDSNGNKVYAQFDPENDQIFTVPATFVSNNIETLLAEKANISREQKDKLAEGKRLTITSDKDEKEVVTIGIDLSEETTLRIVNGNEKKWEEKKKEDRLPKYSFGLYGCWVRNDDNTLTHCAEDEYTPEIKTAWEQRKNANANQAKIV